MKKAISFILCFVITVSAIPVFSAFAKSEEYERRPSYLFAIDAGHGGSDPGAIGIDGRYESNDNLKSANEVIRLLNEQGQRTLLIDRTLATKDRPTVANNADADFLISLHRNSEATKTVSGIDIFTHEPTHIERVQQPQKDLPPAEWQNKHEIDEKLVNNLKTELTAATTMKVYDPHYGSGSPPVWENYFINRTSNMPSCIIELGYTTSAFDNAAFDIEYKALALAVVKALLKTVDLSYVGPIAENETGFKTADGDTYYVKDGAVAWDYTGTVRVEGETYYIKNGYVTDIPAGKSGDCDWFFCENKLTVSGCGSMADYDSGSVLSWSNVKKANVNSGVTRIGDYTFNGCASLTEISIPSTVTAIGDNCFLNCTALETVVYMGSSEDFSKISVGENNEAFLSADIICFGDVVYGDVTGEGDIDAVDLAGIKLHILGIRLLEGKNLMAADINNDTVIDAVDLAGVKLDILGIRKINN